jgi:hypothetical protein
LLDLFRKDKIDLAVGFIRFENMKGSQADRLAKQVFDGEAKADKIVEYSKLESLLRGKKTSRGCP